jgi:transposase
MYPIVCSNFMKPAFPTERLQDYLRLEFATMLPPLHGHRFRLPQARTHLTYSLVHFLGYIIHGYGVSETARNLGINAHMLGRWKREVEAQQSAAFPGNGRVSPDQEELQQLREDNKRLRIERDILKKALGYFANGSN